MSAAEERDKSLARLRQRKIQLQAKMETLIHNMRLANSEAQKLAKLQPEIQSLSSNIDTKLEALVELYQEVSVREERLQLLKRLEKSQNEDFEESQLELDKRVAEVDAFVNKARQEYEEETAKWKKAVGKLEVASQSRAEAEEHLGRLNQGYRIMIEGTSELLALSKARKALQSFRDTKAERDAALKVHRDAREALDSKIGLLTFDKLAFFGRTVESMSAEADALDLQTGACATEKLRIAEDISVAKGKAAENLAAEKAKREAFEAARLDLVAAARKEEEAEKEAERETEALEKQQQEAEIQLSQLQQAAAVLRQVHQWRKQGELQQGGEEALRKQLKEEKLKIAKEVAAVQKRAAELREAQAQLEKQFVVPPELLQGTQDLNLVAARLKERLDDVEAQRAELAETLRKKKEANVLEVAALDALEGLGGIKTLKELEEAMADLKKQGAEREARIAELEEQLSESQRQIKMEAAFLKGLEVCLATLQNTPEQKIASDVSDLAQTPNGAPDLGVPAFDPKDALCATVTCRGGSTCYVARRAAVESAFAVPAARVLMTAYPMMAINSRIMATVATAVDRAQEALKEERIGYASIKEDLEETRTALEFWNSEGRLMRWMLAEVAMWKAPSAFERDRLLVPTGVTPWAPMLRRYNDIMAAVNTATHAGSVFDDASRLPLKDIPPKLMLRTGQLLHISPIGFENAPQDPKAAGILHYGLLNVGSFVDAVKKGTARNDYGGRTTWILGQIHEQSQQHAKADLLSRDVSRIQEWALERTRPPTAFAKPLAPQSPCAMPCFIGRKLTPQQQKVPNVVDKTVASMLDELTQAVEDGKRSSGSNRFREIIKRQTSAHNAWMEEKNPDMPKKGWQAMSQVLSSSINAALYNIIRLRKEVREQGIVIPEPPAGYLETNEQKLAALKKVMGIPFKISWFHESKQNITLAEKIIHNVSAAIWASMYLAGTDKRYGAAQGRLAMELATLAIGAIGFRIRYADLNGSRDNLRKMFTMTYQRAKLIKWECWIANNMISNCEKSK